MLPAGNPSLRRRLRARLQAISSVIMVGLFIVGANSFTGRFGAVRRSAGERNRPNGCGERSVRHQDVRDSVAD